jgi:hypothetical protein
MTQDVLGLFELRVGLNNNRRYGLNPEARAVGGPPFDEVVASKGT